MSNTVIKISKCMYISPQVCVQLSPSQLFSIMIITVIIAVVVMSENHVHYSIFLKTNLPSMAGSIVAI